MIWGEFFSFELEKTIPFEWCLKFRQKLLVENSKCARRKKQKPPEHKYFVNFFESSLKKIVVDVNRSKIYFFLEPKSISGIFFDTAYLQQLLKKKFNEIVNHEIFNDFFSLNLCKIYPDELSSHHYAAKFLFWIRHIFFIG